MRNTFQLKLTYIPILLCALLSLVKCDLSAQNFRLDWVHGMGSDVQNTFIPPPEPPPVMEAGRHICVDVTGNVYVAGVFTDEVDFDPSAGIALLVTDLFTPYISKYDINGNYLWAKAFPAEFSDIAVDTFGNLFITGSFFGAVDFDLSADTVIISSVSQNTAVGYTVKYDTDGNYLWTSVIQGGMHVYPQALVVSENGNVNLTGMYYGVTDFDPSVNSTILSPEVIGNSEVFITQYAADGTLNWAGSVGGIYAETSRDIDIDSENNLYLLGDFHGIVDFDPSPAIATLTAATSGNPDIFIARYDSNGNYIHAGQITGSGTTFASSIAVDQNS